MNRIVLLFKQCCGIIFTGIGVFLLSSILFNHTAYASAFLSDIKIDLSIETGDKENDFDDMLDTIPKGQFVSYQIHITNNGSVTYHDLLVLMDSPDYMKYVPGSVYGKENISGEYEPISDINEISPLEIGYQISTIAPDSEQYYKAEYQISTDIKDDVIFTVAWADILDKYSSVPLVSNIIENKIAGEAAPALQVTATSSPEPNSKVGPKFRINYIYTIKNLGGIAESNVNLITYIPEHTTCISSCGSISFGSIDKNEFVTAMMTIEVNADYGSAKNITNIGFNYSGNATGTVENRNPIIHIIDETAGGADGDFTVSIIQSPNIVLNSANGITPRNDKSDLTETLYTLTYKGLQKFNTYPTLSTDGQTVRKDSHCGTYTYPQAFGTTTYAYNSNGGECDNIYNCPPTSSPIVFNVNTTLPTRAPKLDFTINIPTYAYGSTSEVNSYMKSGGAIQIPSIFTQSRALENGSMGIVSTAVTTNVTEDMYRYDYIEETKWCTYSTCGKFTCSDHDIYRPVYKWRKVSSQPVTLSDNDDTDITVYTSTAWLKTQGGNIGTNDEFTNYETEANRGDLGNPKVREYFTPSSNYTPPGETNGDYMIFGNNGTGTFKSKSGDSWLTDGAEFPFLEKGEAYDRKDNPRDYYQDMFDREKFGEVKENKLPSNLSSTVDLGDNIIWKNSGDIVIGTAGTDDTVTLSGGRSRIYTDGDVYINANIRYNSSQGENYNDITSVRIDARNIYVNGEVTDLEVMLLARDTFKSGVSRNQLRVLGDVIANNTVWERKPLLEDKPTEFNKPSEYIIEDMRKYVLPPPGDTEIPGDYNVWRQVNPSTGEVLDGY